MGTIGDRIKEILEEMPGPERGKQTRLAEIAECTKALIGQLMKNPAQELGYSYAKNIEKKLGYRVDWLLKGQQPKRILTAVNVDQSSPTLNGDEVMELFRLYKESTIKGRNFIMQSARVSEKSDTSVSVTTHNKT